MVLICKKRIKRRRVKKTGIRQPATAAIHPGQEYRISVQTRNTSDTVLKSTHFSPVSLRFSLRCGPVVVIALMIVCVFLFLFTTCSEAGARDQKDLPLWEAGLFPGVLSMPHYRGSDEYSLWAMPLPYAIYRGKVLQMDREGVQGIFYRSERLETSISGWGNPPVDKDNRARKGMDSLDPVIEAGPSLKWNFTGRDGGADLYLKWALRAVTSVGFPDDFDTAYRGLKSSLNLVYVNDAPFSDNRFELGLNAGLEAADDRYHRYFYEVKPDEAGPERPAYRPGAGFSGLTFSARVMYVLNAQVSLAGYGRWENSSLAIYRDSPLVKRENNFILGAAAIWTLLTSEKNAED
jgi:MipA family protein